MIKGRFTWLVTGGAGFIGSHLIESLLRFNQKVIGIDNFATGYQYNLDEVLQNVGTELAKNFCFYKGDICDSNFCLQVSKGADYILHQAALANVPRSLTEPVLCHATNVTGFVNMLEAARSNCVKRFVYASSSAVYGDSTSFPKVEDEIGRPLSPYAATKYIDEVYAKIFSDCYGVETIGLRYFNVFGARQDPNGAYAAVIPLWIKALLRCEPVFINGDGDTTRDFCYIKNVVQANILAALTESKNTINEVYNIAVGRQITLNALFGYLKLILRVSDDIQPVYRDFRIGDIRHSLADIGKARQKLGYEPEYRVNDGLDESIMWYKEHLNS